MKIFSSAFEDGGAIPIRYTKDGEDMSPPLQWQGVPRRARELALVFECLTPETREPVVQWLIFRIPKSCRSLPEGMRRKAEPDEPEGAMHGINDIGNLGYEGPLGTIGRTYRFRFRLFALDRALDLEPGVARQAFAKAIAGHVLKQADLHVIYDRPR